VQLQAEAIEFDFMQPTVTGRQPNAADRRRGEDEWRTQHCADIEKWVCSYKVSAQAIELLGWIDAAFRAAMRRRLWSRARQKRVSVIVYLQTESRGFK
jgi:hypothetical protein